MFNASSLLEVHINKTKTEYSHLSYLTIEKISTDFNGNISCTANHKTKSITNEPDTEKRTFAIKMAGKLSAKLNKNIFKKF